MQHGVRIGKCHFFHASVSKFSCYADFVRAGLFPTVCWKRIWIRNIQLWLLSLIYSPAVYCTTCTTVHGRLLTELDLLKHNGQVQGYLSCNPQITLHKVITVNIFTNMVTLNLDMTTFIFPANLGKYIYFIFF